MVIRCGPDSGFVLPVPTDLISARFPSRLGEAPVISVDHSLSCDIMPLS